MKKKYFCKDCNMLSPEEVCPNCFLPAREVGEGQCPDCGNDWAECLCQECDRDWDFEM